ncbi:flavin reductase family protein [Treponema phagedenis]|uniref:Flavin reductase family protein n=1 Tax=Treponema phagedenis TaxID=162 RepID=A0A0B7GYL9_TREPH|nr:flavin reductase family protein [Treponema phagedenis]EFW37832.1 flavoredoxin [Treponema phagedenis F0421]NVP24701.1 flavin reductase family protein [Treponema phagedenis]QEJ95718.1 flavin reductase family protein [Treponema phagedenis]QEJ98818.1 flavin reductase family protein [Treponema phagedenis]QEK00516.1 flavin reductase family protein [Treponema phagedenis]
MRKDFGVKTWFYPLPVLIVGTYDENGKANAMNAAWGGIYDTNQVIICLSPGHKTAKNIHAKKAFTISFADADHVVAADYVGIASGNKVPDKMEKAGFTTEKSVFVDAPIIRELPMALECRLIKTTEEGNFIGEIVNISADEKIIGEDDLIDAEKLQAICYDPVHHDYLVLGKKVGKAFSDGKSLE